MSEASRHSSLAQAIWLTAVMAFGWLLCVWPAMQVGGQRVLGWMSLAVVCCLVPGWIVVFLSGLAIFSNPMSAMLIQTMCRLGVVSCVAVVVRKLRPEIGVADFFGWLIGFYLLALATEVVVLRRGVSSRS